MLKFQLEFEPSFCVVWPQIKILHNENLVKVFDTKDKLLEFQIKEQSSNVIKIDYFNKTDKHTKVESNNIVTDQYLELKTQVRVDNILLEPWFITDGIYEPRYFKSYQQQQYDKRINSELPKSIKSQLIWHFPGSFIFPNFNNFWDDYFEKKKLKEVIKFLDKDPERIEKYRGSLEPYNDLVNQIKKLIL